MKCRGCGSNVDSAKEGTNVEGLGWMHNSCEIERLRGLLDEYQSIAQTVVEDMSHGMELTEALKILEGTGK